MWAEACELLERAERMRRQFFQFGVSPARRPAWEPPVDIFETEQDLSIVVALPGVMPGHLEVGIQGNTLIVAGERRLPMAAHGAAIHQLEIPHGRFERRIELPPGRFEPVQQDLVYGCLLLVLRKLR
jgi:HSP20 family molecular chaperone IbpA